jgi:DNA polymerase III epsilon subunit-like protein
MYLTFFDLETGGLAMDHPIIQLAAVTVDLNQDWKEVEHFERKLLFIEDDCDPEALRINHYYERKEAWEREALHSRTVATGFASYLQPYKDVTMTSKAGRPYKVAKLVSHNKDFDDPRLKKLFRHYDIFLPADPRVLCTMQLGMWYSLLGNVRLPSFKLGELCKHFKIELPDAHDALADCRAAAQICRALMAALGN